MAAMRRSRGGRLGQGLGGIAFLEQPLAVQIAGLHVIAIDQGEASDAGARQGRRMETSQRAAAHDGGVAAQRAPPARARRYPERESGANSARARKGSCNCDGSKVARNTVVEVGLQRHQLSWVLVRSQLAFLILLLAAARPQRLLRAISEVRRPASGQHPVRARRAAARGRRTVRDAAAEAGSAAAHVRGARQHRAPVRHRPVPRYSSRRGALTTAV